MWQDAPREAFGHENARKTARFDRAKMLESLVIQRTARDHEVALMNRDWRAGDDAHSLATELEQRALTHEKVLDHLDLRAARALRDLARRIRAVASSGEREDADRQACHVELLKLRLEAMSALLTELATKAPRISPPQSHGATRTNEGGERSAIDLAARRRAAGKR